jgi:hypothetical protein
VQNLNRVELFKIGPLRLLNLAVEMGEAGLIGRKSDPILPQPVLHRVCEEFVSAIFLNALNGKRQLLDDAF